MFLAEGTKTESVSVEQPGSPSTPSSIASPPKPETSAGGFFRLPTPKLSNEEESKLPSMKRLIQLSKAINTESPNNFGRLDDTELTDSCNYVKNLMETAQAENR